MAASLFRKLRAMGQEAAGVGGVDKHAGNAVAFTKSNFEQVMMEGLGSGSLMEKWDYKKRKMRAVKTKLDLEFGRVECVVIKKGLHRRKRKVIIPLTTIKEVRLGEYTKSFKKMNSMGVFASQGTSFSIIYGPKFETLDLVCATQEDLSVWTSALQWIIDNISCKDEKNHFLKVAFKEADKNGNGLLDMDEVAKVIHLEGMHCIRHCSSPQMPARDSNSYILATCGMILLICTE